MLAISSIFSYLGGFICWMSSFLTVLVWKIKIFNLNLFYMPLLFRLYICGYIFLILRMSYSAIYKWGKSNALANISFDLHAACPNLRIINISFQAISCLRYILAVIVETTINSKIFSIILLLSYLVT